MRLSNPESVGSPARICQGQSRARARPSCFGIDRWGSRGRIARCLVPVRMASVSSWGSERRWSCLLEEDLRRERCPEVSNLLVYILCSADSFPTESASMGKPTDLAARRSTSGGNPSRHAAPQGPGPATLALATPAKPRGNHFSHRPSIHHYPTEGTNNGYRQEMTRHTSSSTLLGRPGDFVAETPALPGGRQQSRSAATFTRAPSLSTYPSGRFGGTAQNGFDAQAAGDDDLADFMVDTDEEDDGVLFSGGNRRRSSHATQGRPSVRHSVEDVPEVPETPMKAI